MFAVGLARAAWFLGYLAVLATPRALLSLTAPDEVRSVLEMTAVNTGLVALSLLVTAFLVMGRFPSLLGLFGVEAILRIHRVVAVLGAVLVALHVVFVLLSDPRGLSIFDLRTTTWAARAAVASTVALGAIVALALLRKRRQPRYEGWRMLHIALALTVFLGAWLHVWWLHHLAAYLVLAAWFAGLGLLVLVMAVRRWLYLPLKARRHSYLVEQVTESAGDAVTLSLEADRHDGLPFRAGQFVWLKIGTSPFVFEEHPFTIASTAEAPDRLQFTIKALGDFSELVRAMRPGRRVFLDGPYGQMGVDGLETSRGFVFIAGGIGITPMLSMLRTLADRRDHRRHLLIVGARTESDVVLRPEIEELRSRLRLTVVYVLGQPPDSWAGERGRVDGALLDRWVPTRAPERHDYFVCGPPAMVVTVDEELQALGIPGRRIHTERFEVV